MNVGLPSPFGNDVAKRFYFLHFEELNLYKAQSKKIVDRHTVAYLSHNDRPICSLYAVVNVSNILGY